MCEKKPYCNRKVDECIRDIVTVINRYGIYRTISSCCGHNKYPRTIIVMDKITKEVKDYDTQTHLSWGKRKRNRYYKKDSEHH